MIINLCRNDFANFAEDNAASLRSIGVACKAYKLSAHVNKYPTEAQVVTEREIIHLLKRAEVVQIFHSDKFFLPWLKRYRSNKHTVVYHTASNYRKHSEFFNKEFNPLVRTSFLCLGEFWDMGAFNPVYLVGGVSAQLVGDPRLKEIRTFAHHPSNVLKKGTELIQEVMKAAQRRHKIKYNGSEVWLKPYLENQERIKECDIYIEMCQAKLNGASYGSWGITCLEAAALGKVVVTNHIHKQIYKDTYGDYPLRIANNERELKERISHLCSCSNDDIIKYQVRTYEWFKKNHSYEPTGKRIWDHIKKN